MPSEEVAATTAAGVDKKMLNGKSGQENFTPKQKRAFVKMLSKFIRLVSNVTALLLAVA